MPNGPDPVERTANRAQHRADVVDMWDQYVRESEDAGMDATQYAIASLGLAFAGHIAWHRRVRTRLQHTVSGAVGALLALGGAAGAFFGFWERS